MFDRRKKPAGKDWVRDFCKRHEIPCTQEKCYMGRIMGCSRIEYEFFFENSTVCCEEKHLGPHKILIWMKQDCRTSYQK
jgi:hypothetical protein